MVRAWKEDNIGVSVINMLISLKDFQDETINEEKVLIWDRNPDVHKKIIYRGSPKEIPSELLDYLIFSYGWRKGAPMAFINTTKARNYKLDDSNKNGSSDKIMIKTIVKGKIKCLSCTNSEYDPDCGYTCTKELWQYLSHRGKRCPQYKKEKK